jgi:predicted Zn-dependent protease
VLNLELGLAHLDLAFIEQLGHFDLLGGELLGALVLERADRDHRQARIDLDRGDRIAGIGAEEGLLEIGVGNGFGRAGKAGAGVILGSQNIASRTLTGDIRRNEQSADHAALTYLDANDISATGMLEMFEVLRQRDSGGMVPPV